ncbi:MAG: hypothetical protein QG641_2756 [Candidatus Poribacteria bacterium]|nr:hypothetical protein [Candidatus Poribacteria bacterium]MDQ1329466.1 hypothetical protein [Candidatus Poribacteria bacterium]
MPIQKKRAGKNPLYKRVNQNVVSRCYINYMIIQLYCQEKRRNTKHKNLIRYLYQRKNTKTPRTRRVKSLRFKV